ncbi:MAG: hypothetical protein PVG79_04400 [Gemmatimonadales bacterium]|jgi:hypothetical protein
MLSRRALLSTTVVAGLALSQTDCTMIGAGLGELIDATTARSLAPHELAPETLEPGQKITVRLRNSRSIEGTYIGIEPLPADEYAARYASTADRPSAAVPQPALVLRTAATGGRAGVERRVPLDRIALVEWDSDKGRTVGTIVGGVIDAVALVYLTAAMAACAGGWGGFGY